MYRMAWPRLEQSTAPELGWQAQQRSWRAQQQGARQELQVQWKAAKTQWAAQATELAPSTAWAPHGARKRPLDAASADGVGRWRLSHSHSAAGWPSAPRETRQAPRSPVDEAAEVAAGTARERGAPPAAPREPSPAPPDEPALSLPQAGAHTWAARVAREALGADVGTEDGRTAVRRAVERAHRKPRRAVGDYADEDAQSDAAITAELEWLVPLLPCAVVTSMLGGDRGVQQLADPARRAQVVARTMRARAGTDGARIRTLRTFLQAARAYALTVMRTTMEECDSALFPMSPGLAHDIVHEEQARATKAAKGSKGGATVGNGVREAALLAVKLGWPVEATKESLAGAAPKATASARKKAGVLPLAARCQLEAQARGEFLDDLDPDARHVCRFYARSLLAGGLDQSTRVQEGVRVYFLPGRRARAATLWRAIAARRRAVATILRGAR
jgi:hypothetical protein